MGKGIIYVEQHVTLNLKEYEGLWELILKHPQQDGTLVTVYIETPGSDYDKDNYDKTIPIVEPGDRLLDVLQQLAKRIDYFPYKWDLAGTKIVPYGYDFETDLKGGSITYVDLTNAAYKSVLEHYNLFSPIEGEELVEEYEEVSGKGVMAKIKIVLDKPKYINHLAIDFFAEYPIDIMSFMYQQDEKEQSPIYELSLSNVVSTNSSLHLHFPHVYGKVFYIIIRQETYTLINGEESRSRTQEIERWRNASDNSKSVYLQQVETYLSDAVVAYGEKLRKELESISPMYTTKTTSNTDGNYRSQFLEIKKRLDQQ